MKKARELNKKVKQANKEFYDSAVEVYEKVDKRRNLKKSKWLSTQLFGLSKRAGKDILLDLGCGTGFIAKLARKHYTQIYGIDISKKVLEKAKPYCDKVVCGDINKLPFKKNSINVVTSFSVLHHCYEHEPIFKEVYRVLKKNGVFYTDHDLDIVFNKNFKLPLKIYRKIVDPGRRYIKEIGKYNNKITRETYDLSEIHSEGLDTDKLVQILKKIGFREIEVRYHWEGINNQLYKLFSFIFKNSIKRGFAPVFSIVAVK